MMRLAWIILFFFCAVGAVPQGKDECTFKTSEISEVLKLAKNEIGARTSCDLRLKSLEEKLISKLDADSRSQKEAIAVMFKNELTILVQSLPLTNAAETLNSAESKQAELCHDWKEQLDVEVTTLTNGTYHFNTNDNDTLTSWWDARDFCNDRNMSLVSFNTEGEMRAVWKNATKPGYYWVGAINSGQTPEDFIWQDGQEVDNSFFRADQPDDIGSGNDTCLYIAKDTEIKLLDASCSHKGALFFICEVNDDMKACF